MNINNDVVFVKNIALPSILLFAALYGLEAWLNVEIFLSIMFGVLLIFNPEIFLSLQVSIVVKTRVA
jgi:hypothetical protein